MSHALPRADFSLVFPPDPGWVRTAREAVRTALRTANRTDLTDTALLLTSEAVTNAVNDCRNSGCSAPVTLSAEWGAHGTLRLHVTLAGDATDAENGRGLLIIGSSATDWGVCHHGPGPGKAVWFQVNGTGV